MEKSGLLAGDTLSWREVGIVGRRDSIYKNAFTSEQNKYASRWDGGVKLEGGQVGKIEYIYSVIYLFTIHQYVLGPVLRGWGLPLVTNSELEGLECQIKELGINAEAKLKLWNGRGRKGLAG